MAVSSPMPTPTQTWENLPLLLTTAEVARILRLSQAHIRELAANGTLPAARLGPRGDFRIARAALQRFIEGA